MSIKALFGEIAVALSHLKSATDKVLHGDQQAAIDNALAALKAAELDYESHLKADVLAALHEAVAGLAFVSQTQFETSLNDLGGRVAALETSEQETEVGLADLKSALEDLGRQLDPPPAETPPAGAGDDSVDAGGGDDSIPAGAGDDTLGGEGGGDTVTDGGANDSLDAGGGDDSLGGDGGGDSLDGGGGNDTTGDDSQPG